MPPDGIEIRHAFRPGDIGTIVFLHGTVYAVEKGWDHTFEAYVAAPLGEFAKRQRERERVWLVDRDGKLEGSLALVEASATDAQLRWLLFTPALRGRGLGKRLIGELIAFAREQRYERIYLWTVAGLAASAALYAAAGFAITEEQPRELWGDRVIEQRWELVL